MGMIVMLKGEPYVFEAVSPTSKPKANELTTPYADWVRRGKDNKVWIKRLIKEPDSRSIERYKP